MSTHRQQNKKCIHVQCRVSYSRSKSKQLKNICIQKIKQKQKTSQNVTIIIKVKSNK